MKKVTKIFGMMCMASVLAIGASSCNKDNTKTVSSFNFSLPAIEGENPFEDDSKAYIDMVDGVMKWYDGDEMMIYTIDEDVTNSRAAVYTSKTGITGATQAQFAGPHLAEGSEGFFAFYPASKASTTITEGNRVSFNVGGTQNHVTDLFANTARAGRIFMDPQGFVGASTCDMIGHTVSASLKHIFGYINVRIKDTNVSGRRLKSVTITDNQMHLTGSMSVCLPAVKSADLDAMKQLGENFKSNGNVATYMAGLESKLQEIGYMSEPDATSSVTLNVDAANEGMGATIDGSYRFFLMPLRPGALIGNFTVTLKFMEGDDVIINVPANKKYISIPGYYTNVSIDLKNGGTIL
jgi:hypothetical protein